MSRYNTTSAIKDIHGKRRAETTIISIPFNSNDIYIRTTTPERLDQLSADFYGTVDNWYMIASANGLGKGSIWSPAEMELRIPDVPDIDKYVEQLNKSR